MKNFNILLNSFQVLFPNLDSILTQALQNTSEYLSNFRNDAGYSQKLETAFGSDFNGEVANQLFDGFAQGNFSAVPTIEIVNRHDINGANGAFSITTGKVYLAAEFINQNAQNINAVVAVLLEEIGHSIDAEINTTDAAGDEGDIFARLVQGKSLSESELAVLKAEDDSATLTLDGEVVEIEQNLQGKRLNEVAFLGTHNSHVNSDEGYTPVLNWAYTVANQSYTIQSQLEQGVRFLGIDTYEDNQGVYLAHNPGSIPVPGFTVPSGGRISLKSRLEVVVNFLNQRPNEIVIIDLEDYTSQSKLQNEIDQVSGLKNLLFDPDHDDPNTAMYEDIRQAGVWPLTSEMIAQNKRLLIFSESNGSIDGIADTRTFVKKNDWRTTDLKSRWNGGIYDNQPYPQLYFLEHTDASGLPTDFSTILARVASGLSYGPNQLPNVIHVDHFEHTDAGLVVDWLNASNIIIHAISNILHGGLSDDNLFGTVENDKIYGHGGNDTIDGGGGNDIAVFTGASVNYQISWLNNGDLRVIDSQPNRDGTDILKNIEQINFDGGGVYKVFKGDDFNNTLMADGYWALMYGGAGNDILYGGLSDDNISGGAGNDILYGNITFGNIYTAHGEFSPEEGWSSFDQYPRQVADVNGDGYADIVGFGSNGVLVALGNQNGLFATPKIASTTFVGATNWEGFNRMPRQLADVNGDGRADIVGFGGNGVYVARGKEDGTFDNIWLTVSLAQRKDGVALINIPAR
ncbi:FG-GAP-like repeat-containing protein [Dolichospermum sp. UHCC 0259]|uniref:FG-GAP-like repeat-containing protein n=1 Tax=Dolichospermum sp. UHCC 0259 TaxID=2590010 RepID=UPI00144792FA|nr:FG-GAP-like repeat-containing protein [Dolichospermum sp. UHCC 0259]MTJ49008.1 hypothetical protein [Dolichospermum sp. UHCC 0259]